MARASPSLTKIGQQSEEIFAEDGLVFVLVIKLQDLNEIVNATSVLGVLGLLEDGVHVLEGDHPLALLLQASDLGDGVQGGVQVAGTDQVTNVEAIDLALSLEVIDLEGELDFCESLGYLFQLYVLKEGYFSRGFFLHKDNKNWSNFVILG